jgi:hypothetical protein
MNALLEWLSNSGAAVLVASLLSLAAIVVSLLAYFNSRKALRIEEARERDRLAAIRKADLTACLIAEDRGPAESGVFKGIGSRNTAYFLQIENRGRAEARAIELRLDDSPLSENTAHGDPERISYLGPGSKTRVHLPFGAEWCSSFELELSWQDDSGAPGRYRTTLTY